MSRGRGEKQFHQNRCEHREPKEARCFPGYDAISFDKDFRKKAEKMERKRKRRGEDRVGKKKAKSNAAKTLRI